MTKKRILIVGGVAGGASAAARIRRLSEDAEIIIFERGEYISFANCGLPYHIGGEIIDRDKLLIQTPEKMHNRFNIDVRINSEVISIDRNKKEITILDKTKNKKYNEKYDYLILSPGANPVRPPIPGIDNERIFSLRNMDDMDAINNFIDEKNPKSVVVIGGGYIGLEMAENLHLKGLNVTLVELLNQVMAPVDPEMATFLHQELMLNGVDLRLGISVTGFDPLKDMIEVQLSTNDKVESDMVILAIGVKPENKLAKDAKLNIGKLGGVLVDEHMRTNDPNIYAVGDVVEVDDFISGKKSLIPLAGPANRQGRIAADNIFGRDSIYNRTQGTGICKVFNQTIAMTGMNEKALKKNKIKFEKIYVHPSDHAGYYPGATPISLKLLFNPKNGKILGAQAVGMNGIDKKIDVLAMAIRFGLSVFDLEKSELCYAPPYGSAKDVINYAGFVAANVIKGDVKICHVNDVLNIDDKKQILLDIRTIDEFSAGSIPGSINIPIDELRERLNELSKDKEILVFCRVGLRGYLACRILSQHGFNCRNLTGGYTTYLLVTNKLIDNVRTNDRSVAVGAVKEIDACGLQCPGPIQKLKKEIDELQDGESLNIITTDPGFVADAPAWCNSTGNELINIVSKNGKYCTTIRKHVVSQKSCSDLKKSSAGCEKEMTMVVFSGDFDKAMAAFIIANGAAAMGYKPTLFFTFWGLNILRKNSSDKIKKTFIERMFGKMMPRGADKIALSKMHMLGMGTAMIKSIMRKKQVASLPELIQNAKDANVNLIACAMSMDLMGVKPEELIDGIEMGGVASYLDKTSSSNLNLFI